MPSAVGDGVRVANAESSPEAHISWQSGHAVARESALSTPRPASMAVIRQN
jgi:hypothetical protein